MTGPVDSVKLPSWVKAADVADEMLKWERAVNYSKTTHSADIAYDGALFVQDALRDALDFCAAAKLMQPAYFFADAEGWGGGWNTLYVEGGVNSSANAQARRRPGESYENLAFRMVQEMLQLWTKCMKTDAPNTTVFFYSTQFPLEAAARAGIVEQPSHYPISNTDTWAATIRQQRHQADAAGVPLVPWISSCTFGMMSASQLRVAVLHALGCGAAGFSFFSDSCVNDPAILLALSAAIAAAVPFEDLLLAGAPATPLELQVGTGVAVGSGVVHGEEMWLVLTAESVGLGQGADVTEQGDAADTASEAVHLEFSVMLGNNTSIARTVPNSSAQLSGALIQPVTYRPQASTLDRTGREVYSVECAAGETIVLHVGPATSQMPPDSRSLKMDDDRGRARSARVPDAAQRRPVAVPSARHCGERQRLCQQLHLHLSVDDETVV